MTPQEERSQYEWFGCQMCLLFYGPDRLTLQTFNASKELVIGEMREDLKDAYTLGWREMLEWLFPDDEDEVA